jgi:hypothetical protein
MVSHVQQKIASHHAQADHADFISLLKMLICHGFASSKITAAT